MPGLLQDGRVARSTRTAEAILDAFIALVHHHGGQPTMEAVADEALISVRTLYRHHPDVPSVVVAALAHSFASFAPPDVDIAASRPVSERVSAIVSGWSEAAEESLVLWALAAATPVEDPDVVASLAASRALGRAQIRWVFERELSRRDGPTRSMMLDAVEAALSVATWYGLRTDQGLSEARARRITEALVVGALALR